MISPAGNAGLSRFENEKQIAGQCSHELSGAQSAFDFFFTFFCLGRAQIL